MKKNLIWARVMVLLCTLSLSSLSFAEYGTVKEEPSAFAMGADLVLVRPVMMGFTVVGSVLWVVSLPFSAAGGNIKEAADTLVIGPAKTTFVRCLGCTQPGYQKD